MQVPHLSREQLIQALLPSVRRAGDLAMTQWKTIGEVMTKPDGSPVTAADIECSTLLCEACNQLDADIPVLSKENCDSPPAVYGPMFVIDPIDGTKEFIAGRKDFTINIALIEENIPAAAIIYAPAHHRLFFCGGIGRAFEEDGEGNRQQLSPLAKTTEAPRIVVSRSHLDERTRLLLGKLVPSSVRPLGSSLKFALIAAGEADFYPRLSPTMIWDCAAGHALIAAVRGVVLRPDGKQLRYDLKDGKMIEGFVASATTELALAAAEIVGSMLV
ncbi:3'(2'),5'-bisphosphate nucleotidase CysQ family protein [Rhizobium mayense]|uniref:3'(2'),5'-bisphosphate nucleotidase CysQ n=1 Tax=Rhizobium mayense TaxID=1312184 RepID=A0ABT7JPQ8_9HYPH|nr:3'(2'),5'-bisphosphate nucleotidase CysQ [Rhizobium mayense]MDL2398326.1 3'(2'),5'-bisphosphate nucleotidase CysQ [Rhizobium mayense]